MQLIPTLLRNDEAARCGQQNHRDQSFLLHGESTLAHNPVVRACVVNENEAIRIHPGEESAHFALSKFLITVAE